MRFDTGQPHAVIQRHRAGFDAADFALDTDCTPICLTVVAAQIKTADSDVVIIIGHTDSVGTEGFNQKLSEQRADAVRTYPIAQGVDAARICSEGRGEKEPIASNATAQGRAQHRRVEVEVTCQEKVGKN